MNEIKEFLSEPIQMIAVFVLGLIIVIMGFIAWIGRKGGGNGNS